MSDEVGGNLPDDVLEQIKDALRRGRLIEAVKIYRLHTNSSLYESKQFVDQMQAEMSREAANEGDGDYVPPAIQRGGGCFGLLLLLVAAVGIAICLPLALAIGQAILMACADLKLVRELPPIQTGERAGGYVRVFLDTADDEASQVFTEALHDALGPLHRPRYVIPRYVDRVTAARLARWLPKFIGRWFERRDRETAMLHAVPRLFAKNAETVAVYQRRWNEFVSPGEAIYALRGAGETLARDAVRNRRTPSSEIHEKEVFL